MAAIEPQAIILVLASVLLTASAFFFCGLKCRANYAQTTRKKHAARAADCSPHARKMLRAAALRRGLGTAPSKRVVVVDGARIPFAMAGTKYKDQMAVDLMRYALRGLLTKTALPVEEVDYVLCGTVVQEPRTSNIAREAAMHAGLPHNIPAHTVSLACVSANAAICQGAEKILSVTQRDFLNFLT